jgi:type IV secretion system protein VirB10
MNPTPNPVVEETNEVIDRDIPDLKTTRKKNNITRLVMIGGLVFALVIAALGITLFMKQLEKNKREEVAEKAKERPKATVATNTANFDTAQARIKREKVQEEEADQAEQAMAATNTASTGNSSGLMTPAGAIAVTATTPQGAAGTGTAQVSGGTGSAGSGQTAPRIQTASQRRMDGDVLVLVGGGNGGFGDDGSAPRIGALSGALPVTQAAIESPRNGLDDKVKPSVLQAGIAGQRQDMSLLLQRGTAIQCGNITKIVSEHSGMVTCVVSNDVYSADGKVVLIERGSKAFGERREVMLQGQARIAAIWSRIDTPYGVFADVNSLATDPLGAAGIPANVDNHLSQRFGGAILLSLIGDIGQAAANRTRDGGGTITFGSTATAGQDLASKTLDNTINIPPTGYVNQGEATTIFVLRDMDFRSVYELARK